MTHKYFYNDHLLSSRSRLLLSVAVVSKKLIEFVTHTIITRLKSWLVCIALIVF